MTGARITEISSISTKSSRMQWCRVSTAPTRR